MFPVDYRHAGDGKIAEPLGRREISLQRRLVYRHVARREERGPAHPLTRSRQYRG